MKELYLILLCVISCTTAYKILGIFPHPGRSHFDFFEPLLKALAEKGHEVTVISHFPQKTSLKRYTDISIADGSHISYNKLNITYYTGARYEKYMQSYILARMGWTSCNKGLPQKSLQDFIKSKPKFDVVLAEFFSTDCYLGIAYKVQAPLIGLSSAIVEPWMDLRLGFPNNPSYIPNTYMPFSDKMSFFERVENTILYPFHHLVFKLLIDIPGNWAAKKYLGDDLPPLQEIAANTSLILTNMHFSLTLPRPLVPGYIEVSGMNIGKPKKLPQNLEKWINESPQGVIYFSLGSMIKVHTFPEERKQIFLRTLGRLPQRILWKWEKETMPGKPDNVMIQKWMPQLDILCHPNVKAYISHGGLLGSTEGVYCGVPMVVLPQFGDQFTNAKALETNGGGIALHFWSVNEEILYNGIQKVLEPSFNKRAKKLSSKFKDRPLPAIDTAIYWVEYVARHGGASHLRTAAVEMPFYKYLLLDVVAFLITSLFAFIFLVYIVTKAIIRRICKTTSPKKIKKG